VSSPSVNSETCHSDKSKWLKEHMGEKWARKLILTKDKTVIIGDYLIDDRIDITGVIKAPAWKHIIFTQPYNRDSSANLRLDNWNMSSILKLLE
jgi:5'-nucleotidase